MSFRLQHLTCIRPGIQGQPFVRWDDPSPEPTKNGYCSHSHVIFPIWHRPYVLLFEQILYDIMVKEVIPQFPEAHQASWREQAESWRLPLWDWARNGHVPDLTKYPTIQQQRHQALHQPRYSASL
ncbi:unnamed protein product [Penicillium nalgiovense]|nr:unnamed protein product [Penicillium nalgiovense]